MISKNSTHAIRAALTEAAAGKSEALHEFTSNAEEYVAMLRMHINKEDHCLFPMAAQALTPEDHKSLEVEFGKSDAVEIGESVIRHYEALAEELARRFEVAPQSA